MWRLVLVVVGAVLATAALASAAEPDWVDRTPEADGSYAYAVGEGRAATQAEAEKEALRDGLEKLAQQVSVTVSARTISYLSPKSQQVVSDARQSVRSRIQGAEPVSSHAVMKKEGVPFFRRSTWVAKVLLRLPRAALDRERERQASVAADFKKAIGKLAREAASEMGKAKSAVAVGGFTEVTSGRRYTFSTVLEKDLADSFTREGLSIVPLGQAKTLVTGGYRIQADVVVVTTRVRRVNSGEQVAAIDAAFDKDGIEPSWLEFSAPIAPEFEALEPARATPEGRVGAISLDSKPQGARVYVDGEDRGRTPLDLREVAVGARAVTLIHEGFEPYLGRLQVTEGDKTPLEAVLTPKTGSLEVTSRPSGATVTLKGKARGRTPLTVRDLPLGPQRLALRLKGHEDALAEGFVRHNEVTTVAVEMVPGPGSIFITSDQSGPTIMVDGVVVGKAIAPKFLRVDSVAAGVREVEAVLAGVGVWRGTVEVETGQVAQVTAVLAYRKGTLVLSVEPRSAKVVISGDDVAGRAAVQAPPLPGVPGMAVPLIEYRAGSGRVVRENEAVIQSLYNRMTSEAQSESRKVSITLSEGEHLVRVGADSFEWATKSVRIFPGAVSKLTIRLKPETAPRHRSQLNRRTPAKAILRGIVFPGWGQFYGANDDEGKRLRGWITMGGVGALTAWGITANQPSESKSEGDHPATTKHKRQDGLAIALFSVAGALHLVGALDGGAMVAAEKKSWSMAPMERGVKVAWTGRF